MSMFCFSRARKDGKPEEGQTQSRVRYVTPAGVSDLLKPKKEQKTSLGRYVGFDIKMLELGNSLSVTGDNAIGTMGGYLKITINGKGDARVYGLTNNHVVNVDTRGKQPVKADDVLAPKVRIPATEDYKATRAKLVNGNAQQKGYVKDFSKRYDKDMGKVAYASGRRIVKGHVYHNVLDWALIRIENWVIDDFQKNYPHSYVNGFSRGGQTPLNKTGVSQFGELDEGLKVFKVGSATGYTEGTIATDLETIDRETIIRDKGNGLEVEAPENCTEVREFYLMGYRGVFSSAGDSGSWVMDMHGRLVGLCWGENKRTDRAFIQPIDLVLRDIRYRILCDEKQINGLTRDLKSKLQREGREQAYAVELEQEMMKRVQIEIYTGRF